MTDRKTILHVAKESGVSPATVSRVMNNHPYVKEATRNKVMEVIGKLEYQRNNMASGLRSNKAYTIGLIVPRISMFFQAEIITAVQRGLYAHGYQLMICQSDDTVEMEKSLVKALHAARVDAVIAACSLHTTDFTHFDILMQGGVPVIFYDRVPMHKTEAILIKGDDVNGGYIATSHLIEAGCKKIAHISGPVACNLYKDRSAGFEKAMKEHGLPVKDEWVFHQELTAQNALSALEKIFRTKNRPDGLFADNDTTAIAALQYAKEHNISVPGELKIVGYSNDPRSSIISPSVTTVEQHPAMMGEKVVETLINVLTHKKKAVADDHPALVIPVTLIKRASA